MRAGENTLRVTVDNSLEPNCRWYTGSGIYRPVHLMVKPKDGVRPVKIRTVSIAPAVVEVQTEIEHAAVENLGWRAVRGERSAGGHRDPAG